MDLPLHFSELIKFECVCLVPLDMVPMLTPLKEAYATGQESCRKGPIWMNQQPSPISATLFSPPQHPRGPRASECCEAQN